MESFRLCRNKAVNSIRLGACDVQTSWREVEIQISAAGAKLTIECIKECRISGFRRSLADKCAAMEAGGRNSACSERSRARFRCFDEDLVFKDRILV